MHQPAITSHLSTGRPATSPRSPAMHRPARLASILPLLAAFFLPLSLLAASLSWNLDGVGTWDDTTSANWTGVAPARVPESGDNVTINRANGATVAFASSNFDTDPEALASLTLGGTGAANTLQIGSGDTLRYNNVVTVNNGGSLVIDSGLVQDTYTTWRDSLKINHGGSVAITGGEFRTQQYGSVYLADTAGHSASLEVSGTGKLGPVAGGSAGGDFNASAGNSTLLLDDDGVISIYRTLNLGTTGGTHDWTIDGGTLQRVGGANYWYVGNNAGNGSVTLTQTGGTFNQSSILFLRETTQYQLSGGDFQLGTLHLDGQIIQTGGDTYITNDLHVGSEASEHGQYTATAGTLRTRGLHIGRVVDSSGTLFLGAGVTYTNGSINGNYPQSLEIGAISGSGTGTLEIQNPTITGTGFAYAYVHQTGVVKGYGTLGSAGGNLQMNGRVIADGYGVDRTLNMAGAPPITNTVDNPVGGTKGWYAVNHGKLTLPNLAVTAGASARNWGEDATDTSLDLVNSLRLEFTGIQSAGTLSISLLASDRADVPEAPFAAYGGTLIGIWDIVPGGGFAFGAGSVDLTFRYDDALAPATKDLYVFHYTGGQWLPITSGIDLNTKTIWADGVTSFSLFAVGYIPEPASALLLALASLGTLRRRQRS